MTRLPRFVQCTLLTLLLVFVLLPGRSCAAAPPLSPGQLFQQPPDWARPWVYWFWLNGNVTREGITADLEAMKRVGIGGVLIMEVDQGAPLGPVPFMSQQWRDLFKFVVKEAKRLGLQVNMNDDAGWNGSGGPWIKPEQSMQKVVWSETFVEGPKHFEASLPQPQTVAGFYRDITVQAFLTPAGTDRIPDIADKACYQVGFPGPADDTKLPADAIIDQGNVKDLSAQVRTDGTFVWDVPPGKWTIMRFGHTSTGVQNAPSPASGRGLECDKLSKEGSEANFNGMIGKLIDDVGEDAGKVLVSTHVDSWENGAQNWTARMREEFQARRGYDPLPFLPVMSGRVIGSLEVSERFLWDLRQTISDLLVENYAGHLESLAQQHGLRLSIEAYGCPCDDQPYAGRADEPMCEFWTGGGAFGTIKEMASAVHTYGKPILGAESFTSGDGERWLQHPATIKALGDQAFCGGVSRYVFHRYAMQPWLDRRPGMTMGPWGLHYERTETWWNWTPAWHEYISRCQLLLRQGHFVADLCYLNPEAAPQGFQGHSPVGYDYDDCCAEVVFKRMSVKEGRIVLPDGMSYRALVLPEVRRMTIPLLQKIQQLVKAGATVIGPRPLKTPGLTGYPDCDNDLQRLAGEIWGDCDGQLVKENRLGLGRVVWGISPEKVLARAGVAPDFMSQTRLSFIHRTTEDTDLYFVANGQPRAVDAVCRFRVIGRIPEFWWPDSGRIEVAPSYREEGSVTSVDLPLGPSGSVFVMFRESLVPLESAVVMSHDGKRIFSLSQPARSIIVQKALYGVLDDPQRTKNVTEQVQQIVDAGDLSFVVSRMADGGDPAPNVVKTLSIDYTVGGRLLTATGKDPDTIRLIEAVASPDAAKIVVDKAVYGVLDDPQRTRDVKARVQNLVDAGEVDFQVARLAEGDDPAYRVVKTVIIDYTIGGRHFRTTGTDPDTVDLGGAEGPEPPASIRRAADGSLLLEARAPGSYDVQTSLYPQCKISVADIPEPLELTGPWDLRFPPNGGAPDRIKLDKLISWADSPDPGVKYYSGAATYTTLFEVPRSMPGKDRRLYLDLGRVKVMARVKLNGKDLGVLWKPPYRMDVTGEVKPGRNSLSVEVVNLWINRMIGDEQLPEDSDRNGNGTLKSWPAWLQANKPSPTGRFTFTTWRLWHKNDPLQESGLVGPVSLRATKLVPVEMTMN